MSDYSAHSMIEMMISTVQPSVPVDVLLDDVGLVVIDESDVWLSCPCWGNAAQTALWQRMSD